MDSIEYMYRDPQFESVLYYFKANDILDVSALQNFDFQELLFVPGVSPALVENVIKIYEEQLTSAVESGALELIKADRHICELAEGDDSAEASVEDESSVLSPVSKPIPLDIKITDIYAGVPRSSLFINLCNMHGKKFMHQLCYEDFEDAKQIRGLGLASLDNLKAVFEAFLISGQSESRPQSATVLPTSISADTPIEKIFRNLPYGLVFCDHCTSSGFSVLSDLKDFSFDHKEVKGIGAASMKRLQQVYLNAAIHEDASPIAPSEFSDIPLVNYGIPIPHKALIDEGYFCISDICQKGLPIQLFVQIRWWLEDYKESIVNIFANEILNVKENAHYCLMMRASGHTLQQIADHIGITRERVRQIVSKSVKALVPTVALLTDAILYPDKFFFCFNDLFHILPDSSHAKVYRFIIKQADDLNGIVYLDFSDKFVKGLLKKHEYEELLRQIAEDEIGEGINFFDNLERIDAQLKEKNMSALDFGDLMNFLVKNGYHFYGDYVMRGRQSYAIVCADAVRKYFSQGIKLNNDESNEDLAQLRKIIARHYTGLELPQNNRALSARLMSVLIQSGRSQYCHLDSVVYSMQLFDEIYDYMQNSQQSSFHYSELFEVFKGRLLAETNIADYNFLHGMLKYLFEEEFDFSDRDIVTKLGAVKQNADMRLKELLLQSGAPLSKKDIKTEFPGISDFVIAFSASREEKLIAWDYNMYNHVDNLDINSEDISRLSTILELGTKAYKGYLSANLLYAMVKNELPSFLYRNEMKSELNLYYTVAYLFKASYRFRRPHILSYDVDLEDPSLVNITKYLLDCSDGLNYQEYLSLSSKLGWANGTIHLIFSELEKEFIRISEDYYIPKEQFAFEQAFLDEFKEKINFLLGESGYYAMFALFSFQGYPSCRFEWNSFLVESILKEYELGFKTLSPQVKDRRYHRGIIVGVSHPAKSFEELVSYTMRKEGAVALNESDFCGFLKQKGLIYSVIPQELYNCSKITFKNEMFSVPGR